MDLDTTIKALVEVRLASIRKEAEYLVTHGVDLSDERALRRARNEFRKQIDGETT